MMNQEPNRQWNDRSFAEHYNTIYSLTLRQILDYLRPLRLSPKDIFIDFGCGNGDILFHASEIVKKAIGIDISAHQLDEARQKLDKRDNVELVESSLMAYEPGKVTFTKGSARKSLHHLTDNEKKEFILRMGKHFKKGSLLGIEDAIYSFDKRDLETRMPEVLEEAGTFYGERWAGIKDDFVHMLREEYPTGINVWQEILKAGGFTIIEATHVTSFLARITARKV